MTSEEKYYRRALTALDELEYIYKDGFNEKTLYKVQDKCHEDFKFKDSLYYDKINALKLSILISYIGLNKESIENANIFNQYNSMIPFNEKKIIKDILNNNRNYNTDFDSWLSINKAGEKMLENNNVIIDTVRNGLLHSNFIMESNNIYSFTNIKIRNYYESKIFNDIFFDFVFAYYSNIDAMGVVDDCRFQYSSYNDDITCDEDFVEFLYSFNFINVNYKNSNFNGNNTLNQEIQQLLNSSKNAQINENKFKQILDKHNVKMEDVSFSNLNDYTIKEVARIVKSKYGNEFYNLDRSVKYQIISYTIEHLLHPKKHICNWLAHFYYVVANSFDIGNKYNNSYFDGDKYCYNLEDAFTILRSYIVLYRLQNKDFIKVDYENLDIDLSKCCLYSLKDGESTEDNYFEECFNKLKLKQPNKSDLSNRNEVICTIIRDALAHSNISFEYDLNNNMIVCLKDIYKGKAKCINMPISEFRKFLNSEVLKPKYCYTEFKDITVNRKNK